MIVIPTLPWAHKEIQKDWQRLLYWGKEASDMEQDDDKDNCKLTQEVEPEISLSQVSNYSNGKGKWPCNAPGPLK